MQEELQAGQDLVLPYWHGQTQNTVQGWWSRIRNRLESENVQPPGGRRTFPEELSPKMEEKIQGVFDEMQAEVDAGRDLDVTAWNNQMGEHVEMWWDRITGILAG